MEPHANDERRSAFVDGELSEPDRKAFEEELHRNDALQNEVETEQAIKATVSEKYLKTPAPAYLHERIEALIDRESEGVFERLARWLREFQLGPVPSLALASLLVVAVAAAFSGWSTDAADPGELVTIEGKIICSNCYLAGKYGADANCPDNGHTNVLMDDSGKLWTFTNGDRWQQHLTDTALWNKRIVLRGHLYPEAQYLDFVSYEFAEPAVAQEGGAASFNTGPVAAGLPTVIAVSGR